MKRMDSWVLGFVLHSLLLHPIHAKPVRVDLNPQQERPDILTHEWENWSLPTDVVSAERDFGSVKVVLMAGNSAKLTTFWWKAGLAHGASMASDGVMVSTPGSSSMKLVLRGLPAGHHSLVTWHSGSDSTQPLARMEMTSGAAHTSTVPTNMVKHNHQAASAFLKFDASAGDDVEIRFESAGPVLLNGFEIDTSDPRLRATLTSPAHRDEHSMPNPRLTWQAAEGAVAHLLYLGESEEAVLKANQTSPEFLGRLDSPIYQTHALHHLQRYYWRVDEVLPEEREAIRGDVWMFRPQFLAFPKAEGYGRFAIGGRGGRVIEVTNLQDVGPGSLRAAVESDGPRTVVFRVSGLISLSRPLQIRQPYLTIAGQTAPGEGICLRNFGCGTMGTHDVIIRHLRVRVGDAARKGLDGMGFASSDHCILDHCTISWTSDEGFSSRGARNITVQRCLISEALQHSFHYKASDRTKFAPHAFAASISGDIGSFHHNLLAHCTDRNWSLAGGYDADGKYAGHLDIRNNIVFNWTKRSTDGGVLRLNYVNNYYKPVASNNPVRWLLKLDPINPAAGHPQYYMRGNVMEGTDLGGDDWSAFNGTTAEQKLVRVDCELFPSFVRTDSATAAYESVLADVGATRPLSDVIDQRILREVRTGQTTWMGSKGAGYDPPGRNAPGIIDTPADVRDAADSPNAPWPAYRTAEPPADSDHDGMPDAWETKALTNPQDQADGNSDRDGDGYTNLEEYLGWLCGDFPAPK